MDDRRPPEGLRILIADDDADQRWLVRRLLARAGYHDVVEASDGDEAVRVAREQQPALVVLDLAMPVRSGVEVLPDIIDAVPDTRVVVVSNFPRDRMARVVRGRGALGYVEKRVGAQVLVRDILVAAALADRVSEQFASEAAAPRGARAFVRESLGAADAQLLDSVELMVSELVTNAVAHASSATRVDVYLAPRAVRVEVYDDDPTMPTRRDPDTDGPGGRGLMIIDQLASQWGSHPEGDGKVVWFELARSAQG